MVIKHVFRNEAVAGLKMSAVKRDATKFDYPALIEQLEALDDWFRRLGSEVGAFALPEIREISSGPSGVVYAITNVYQKDWRIAIDLRGHTNARNGKDPTISGTIIVNGKRAFDVGDIGVNDDLLQQIVDAVKLTEA